MKKHPVRVISSFFACFALMFVFGACSGGSTSTDGKTSSHVGTWKADGFEATIEPTEITINIVGNDTKSLYWKGTFHEGSDVVKSAGDTDAMSESMLGSQDSEKNFAVDGDKISFEMSLMGTTKTIHLKRA